MLLKAIKRCFAPQRVNPTVRKYDWIIKAPPLSSPNRVLRRGSRCPRFLLPRQSAKNSNKPTLVLDMDETLLHCDSCVRRTKKSAVRAWAIAKRPGVDAFLEEMAKAFEIVVFTSSAQDYADIVLDKLDPKGVLVSHRLYRQHCAALDGLRVKDLSNLGRALKRVILVDDKVVSFGANPENGLFIRPFVDQTDDRELPKLARFLSRLVGDVDDVRPAVKTWNDYSKPSVL